MVTASDSHHLGFLALHQFVDLGDDPVGQALHFILRTALVVFRRFFVLQQFLQVLVGLAAHAAHGDLGVFAGIAHHLGQLAATLFSQRGHRHTQQVALGRWVQAQVTFANGLLDLRAHALFPGLHSDRARVQQGHVGHLADRHAGAVIVHMHLIQQARVGAAGADLVQLVLEGFDGLAHLAFSGFLDIGNAHDRGNSSNVNQRAFVLALHHTLQRTGLEDAEDLDGQPLVAAQRQRGGVHHLQIL